VVDPQSFIDDATDFLIEEVMGQAFATRKRLGWTPTITIERDANQDGVPVSHTLLDPLITFAAREPAPGGPPNTATFMGVDGQIEDYSPMNIRKGDRFRLPADAPRARGQAAFVTLVYPVKGGVTRALFTLQG
jgi:hypothetical protein